MPTYLCHGFRWERQALRAWVSINDIDDAAPDWLVAPASHLAMLRTMARKFPYVPFGPEWRSADGDGGDASSSAEQADTAVTSNTTPTPPSGTRSEDSETPLSISESPVRLLEEYHYDEDAVDVATPPFAYVADYVVQVTTGVNIAEEMRKYEGLPKKGEQGWFEKLMVGLRLFVAEDTVGLGWYVVVCDDEERDWGWDDDEDDYEEDEEGEEETDEQVAKTSQTESEEKGDVKGSEGGKRLKSQLRNIVPLRKKGKDQE